jgi:DNA-directed RNA polymerase subunit RPC12/RpoP
MEHKCSKCGAETDLLDNGNPICVKCADEIESARKRTATDKADQHRESPPRGNRR